MTDRETLEREALAKVCVSHYYDLADYLDATSDVELLAIAESRSRCLECRS